MISSDRDRRRQALAALCISCWLAISGCADIRRPISSDAYVAVLVDLHLAEARSEIVGDVPPAIRDSILAEHGLTPDRFETVVGFYVDRPDEYLDLYNAVIDSLSAELGALEGEGRVSIQDP